MAESNPPVKVISVAQDSEADRIVAALSDAGIPVSKEYSGRIPMPTVVVGQSTGEIDLYVPASMEEQALDILVGIGALELAEEGELPEEACEESGNVPESDKKASGWLMILLLLLAVVAVLGTDVLMNFVRKLFC